jgi:predicted ATPase
VSLLGFGVKNLRCLTDTGIVPLKPITLLVGRNSSGKSTFLRAFPLLRQSVENARSSPILWHHPDYVDFGTLDLAINNQAAERSVTFEFAVEWSEDEHFGRCELRMEIASAASRPYVRSYDLRMDQQVTRLEFDVEHRLVGLDGEPKPVSQQGNLWLGGVAYLVASLHERGGGRLKYQPYLDDGLRLVNMMLAWPDDAQRDDMSLIGRALSYVDQGIASFMYGVAYLGPQRGVAERSYRLDDVSVEEVNARGTNMAKLLASLTEAEMQSFCAFTRTYLGFETALHIQGVSGEIMIKGQRGGPFVNVADVGFGYAEALPLCAALWSSCVREPSPERRRARLLALEQPELHLHPARQATLPRMLVGALDESRKAGHEVKLMVETHSDAVVNQLGMLVRTGKVAQEDVQILFFDQDPTTRETKVVVTGYERDGALQESWPFGFLVGVPDPLDDVPDAAAEE